MERQQTLLRARLRGSRRVVQQGRGAGTVDERGDHAALLLAFRRQGLIPYESIIDGTRPTTYGERGWNDLDEAEESVANARRDMIDSYELSIWHRQGKRVEFLSEKETLAPIVERVTDAYQVNLTSCKGFSSESMLYDVSRRVARSGVCRQRS
jgi:hypothetical protein